MSSQAEVRSIEALKDFRVALALYDEDTLAALGAVEAEVRRTVQWLEQDRPVYWQEQIKRRREQVAAAKSEVFRRQLQKKPEYIAVDERAEGEPPPKAEASLQEAEKRLTMVRKWQPLLQPGRSSSTTAASSGIKELAAADVPRAVEPAVAGSSTALEAYLQRRTALGAGSLAATGHQPLHPDDSPGGIRDESRPGALDEEDAATTRPRRQMPLTQDAATGSAATVAEDDPREVITYAQRKSHGRVEPVEADDEPCATSG